MIRDIMAAELEDEQGCSKYNCQCKAIGATQSAKYGMGVLANLKS